MLEAMPYHDGYSDSVFMGTAIVAQAGALTGERRYFDMADRHLRFMQQLDLRPDGLYRHRPEADVAWGRGNGFAALGLAMTLSELPRNTEGHAHALQSYRRLMAALLPLQTRDGLWRNVVDHPGAYAGVLGHGDDRLRDAARPQQRLDQGPQLPAGRRPGVGRGELTHLFVRHVHRRVRIDSAPDFARRLPPARGDPW